MTREISGINFGGQIYGKRENYQLAYVKSDEQTYRWDFTTRPVAPDPAIFPVSVTPEAWEQTDFCRFGKDWQWCQADLLSMQMYGKLYSTLRVIQKQIIINVFLKLTQSDRAYNNNNGTDTKNCYVTLCHTTLFHVQPLHPFSNIPVYKVHPKL